MKPVIYQLLPRLFGNYCETRKNNGSRQENGCGHFADITPKALKAIQDLGATHVWYTGVIRHATAERNTPEITKGKAGSPYAITDYYDVDPDLAVNEEERMAEFEALVKRTHRAGLKVIIDFVPNHVAREYKSLCKPEGVEDLGEKDNPNWAFSPLNNFYYCPGEKFEPPFAIGDYSEMPAKATGNDCFTAHPGPNDWYETVKLNYGVYYQGGGEKQFSPIPSTWYKMRDILLFWASKGVDGFRCDMAEMVPVEFWAWAIPQIKEASETSGTSKTSKTSGSSKTSETSGSSETSKTSGSSVLFIAEVYNPSMYRAYLAAGFDYLYDKVGMYDYLRGVTSKNWPVEGISGQWQCVDDIKDRMLYFLENHDEQRIASGFYCGSGLCAEPAMIIAATLGTNPVMVYMGQELGEKGMDCEGFSGIDGRTTIFDYWGVKSIQAWANKGKFDGKNLSDAQQELRAFYRAVLNIARNEKAVTDGKMYDLEYAQGEGFNKHEQFAYLRSDGKESILFVLNFDDRKVNVQTRIPRDAFDYLRLPMQEKVQAVDLLTGDAYSFALNDHDTIDICLPAWKGVALKFV